jgi:hypothetical protein
LARKATKNNQANNLYRLFPFLKMICPVGKVSKLSCFFGKNGFCCWLLHLVQGYRLQ